MRQAFAALEARRREEFDRLGWQLFWIINTRPNFAKRRRPTIPLWRFNPLAKRPARSAAELDAAFDACWEIAEEAK